MLREIAYLRRRALGDRVAIEATGRSVGGTLICAWGLARRRLGRLHAEASALRLGHPSR